jgi:hypothetical protein
VPAAVGPAFAAPPSQALTDGKRGRRQRADGKGDIPEWHEVSLKPQRKRRL